MNRKFIGLFAILVMFSGLSLALAEEIGSVQGKFSATSQNGNIVIGDGFPNTGGNSCGNGYRNGNDQCEAGNYGGASCTSLGYTGGTLGCSAQCTYDTSSCTGTLPSPETNNPQTGNSGGGRSSSGNNNGGNSNSPIVSSTTPLVDSNTDEEAEPITTETTNDDEAGFLNRITGAVVGAIGSAGPLGILIFIAIIVVAAFLVRELVPKK